MANGVNPWLSSAFQNTSNPNQDYQSYLEGLGMDIDPYSAKDGPSEIDQLDEPLI